MSLSKQQLIDFFVAGCKPVENMKIGMEHEAFVYSRETWRRVGYEDGILPIFQEFMRDGWVPINEKSKIIGVRQNDRFVTLEPAGQFELSGGVYHHLHQTKAELDHHISKLQQIGEKLNFAFVPIGFEPLWRREDLNWMPKSRYVIMRNYMPQKGQLGLDMMTRTCTVQANLDYIDEADMVAKMRVAMALQPLVTALYAASPFTESRPNGYLSYRAHVWQNTDPDRSGILDFVLEPDMSFERYVDYLLTVPMYFTYRDGYINRAGQSFADFMHTDEATLQDWIDHATTAFPEVRLKQVLEMRGADVGSAELMIALPAFWVGLLYDRRSLDQAHQLIREWSIADVKDLYYAVPREGLRAMIKKRSLQEVARDVYRLAYQGLMRRGLGEEIYLEALQPIIETGQTRAEKWLKAYENQWQGEVIPLLSAHAL